MACGSCGRSVRTANQSAQARVATQRQPEGMVSVRIRPNSSLNYNNVAYPAGSELSIPKSIAASLAAVEILG